MVLCSMPRTHPRIPIFDNMFGILSAIAIQGIYIL